MDPQIRPAAPADLPAVLELLVTTELADVGTTESTADRLGADWRAPGFDLARDTFVAWDAGRPVAYGMVCDRHGSGRLDCEHYVRPGKEHWPAGRTVLDRMTCRAGEMAGAAGRAEEVLTLGQIVDAAFAVTVLPEAGWRVVRRFSRMTRSLSTSDAADPPLPDGVRLRTVDTEADRRSYHQIHDESFADHWGSEAESYDSFMQRVATWHANDWSLWWLASLDGAGVACLRGSLVAPETGFIHTIGVLKSGRGRGIGAALLRVAFAELARRGCTRAELGVDTGNVTGALRLYQAAGMTAAFRADIWELRVPAATG